MPLGPGFGAEVKGANLIDVASSDAAYRRVRAAFEEHSLLLFRGQKVCDDLQAAFSRAFGPLEIVKTGSVGAGTFYSRLDNLAPDGAVLPDGHRQALTARANQLWHTDSSFKATPALASVLSGRTLPKLGGETEFVSMRLAWERLPSGRQAQLRDLVVRHSYAASRDQIDPELMTQAERDELPPARWRMTWGNPANDRRALYLASHAYAVEGLGDQEGKALLAASSPLPRDPNPYTATRGKRATSSCGTIAPPCIGVAPGPLARRASWSARPCKRSKRTACLNSERRVEGRSEARERQGLSDSTSVHARLVGQPPSPSFYPTSRKRGEEMLGRSSPFSRAHSIALS